MKNKIAEIAILTAPYILCACATASGHPYEMGYARHAHVHRMHAAHVHAFHVARAPGLYGAFPYQGRSAYAPIFPFPSAEYGVRPYGFVRGQPCMSLDDCGRKEFDESGTRGRMGLGADPAHPEGPGNVSD
jgi:hypothetical protein